MDTAFDAGKTRVPAKQHASLLVQQYSVLCPLAHASATRPTVGRDSRIAVRTSADFDRGGLQIEPGMGAMD